MYIDSTLAPKGKQGRGKA